MHFASESGKVPFVTEPFDLSPREASALIGFHEDTLKRWATDGKLAAIKTPGGWWRFRRSDVLAVLAPVAASPEDAA